MPIKGIDYAFSPHPSASQMKAAGVHWVGRYVSPLAMNDTNGKNLTPSECRGLKAAGIDILLFAEQSGGRMLKGHAAGVADARHFDGVTKALGLDGITMYATCDFDAAPGQQGALNSYLDGVASVVGRERTGLYGGLFPVRRALDAGKCKWAVQTVAWSGGEWDKRAHVRQHLQIRVGGVSVDLDDAMFSDYGQWPRPKAGTPKPAKSRPLLADGKRSLRQLVNAHDTSVNRALWLMAHDPDNAKNGRWGKKQAAYLALDDFDAIPEEGMTYWVG